MQKCETCEYEKVCEIPDFVRNDLKSCKTYKEKKVKTNADKIRSMSDEELAEYLEPKWFDCSDFCEDFDAGCAYTCKHNKGAEFLLNWLKSPTTD